MQYLCGTKQMAREGASVYSVDYPLAPGSPFPCAIVSLLRAFVWLKTVRKVKTLSIVGDSAGGSLASFTAALASSSDLMSAFCKACEVYVAQHRGAKGAGKPAPATVLNSVSDFCKLGLGDATRFSRSLPRMKSMVSVYGMLDTSSFWADGPLKTISWIEYHLAVLGMNFCLDCYRSGVEDFPFPMHFVELFKDSLTKSLLDVDTFPRTLLVCGDKDPLVFSSDRALAVLQEFGVEAQLNTYSARHVRLGERARAHPNHKIMRHSQRPRILLCDCVRRRLLSGSQSRGSTRNSEERQHEPMLPFEGSFGTISSRRWRLKR